MREPYDPTDDEIDGLERLRALDLDYDPPMDSPPFKEVAGWSRACQDQRHIVCRGLSRRSCVCRCHLENRKAV